MNDPKQQPPPSASTGATAGLEHDFSKGPCDVCDEPADSLVLGRGRVCSIECMRRLQSMAQADLQRRLLKTRNLAEVEVAQLRQERAASEQLRRECHAAHLAAIEDREQLRTELAHAQAAYVERFDQVERGAYRRGLEEQRAQVQEMAAAISAEHFRMNGASVYMEGPQHEHARSKMRCTHPLCLAALDQQQQP